MTDFSFPATGWQGISCCTQAGEITGSRRGREACLRRGWPIAFIVITCWLLAGCTGLPQGVTPVSGFDVNRYLGKWYEIARLDHGFERGLEKVTAEYELRPDAGLRVVNRGFDVAHAQWREAEGKAYFIDDPQTGRLKVSFFGPFYGSYNIIRLDHVAYRYALVCGPDTSYLWILARSPELDRAVVDELVNHAAELGFDTSRLLYVRH